MNEDQIEEIELGIKSGVDVTMYAKKEFDWEQMREIRLGLESGLDVSLYARIEVNWDEMWATRVIGLYRY